MKGLKRSPATGLLYTTGSSAAVAAVDRLQHELLRYGQDAAVIFRAVEADPDFAVGHALAAAVHLFTLSRAGQTRAAPHIVAAERLAPRATAREGRLVAAVAAWFRGNTARARALHEDLARQAPRDLVAAKIAQFHQLNCGDFAGMRRMTAALMLHNPDVPQLSGMHAFALDQTGDAQAAERLGRDAADRDFDPWAEHAVAHALERHGRPAEAIAWLAPRSARWARCSSFLNSHNWWHLALFHLAAGADDQALALYDSRVWGIRKTYCQDQVNAVSLLARLELLGVAVGPRWEELAGWLAPRNGEHLNGFLDLHYVYGLARAGEDQQVDRMLAALADRAGAADATAAHRLTAQAAAGLVAHARGRPARAAALLGPILPALGCLGGSSTQHALFRLIFQDAVSAAAPAEARRRHARQAPGHGAHAPAGPPLGAFA